MCRTTPNQSIIAIMALFIVVLAISSGCGVSFRHHLQQHTFLSSHGAHHDSYYHCPHCGQIMATEAGCKCSRCDYVRPYHGYAATCWSQFPSGWGCQLTPCSPSVDAVYVPDFEMIHGNAASEHSIPTADAPREPQAATKIEPVVDSKREPVVKPEVGAEVKSQAEPALESQAEPVLESQVEPVLKSQAEPVLEPALKTAVEPVLQSKVQRVKPKAIKPQPKINIPTSNQVEDLASDTLVTALDENQSSPLSYGMIAANSHEVAISRELPPTVDKTKIAPVVIPWQAASPTLTTQVTQFEEWSFNSASIKPVVIPWSESE